jgi:rfaE bifunctional protein nucleotidyltransferase chain/domain
MRESSAPRSASKISSIDSLAERLDRSPRSREGLVLANGIFDLLHVGHVRYLSAARAAGSSLVVAVNSDESARRLKGPGRPLVPLPERLELLAALECVDHVVPFEGDTVEEALRRLRPSAHAKGTDYTVDTVPERAIARELGIQTVIVGDPKGHASSELISRISRAGELTGTKAREPEAAPDA